MGEPMRTRLTLIAVLLFALFATACGGDDPPPPTATAPPPSTATASATPEATATAPPAATPLPPTPTVTPCPGAIDWSQASQYVGQHARIIGPVVGGTFARQSSGQPTFLDVGRRFPDAGRFTVVIWIEDRHKFPQPTEDYYRGRTVCVTGTVELFDGSPQIVAREAHQIDVMP